MVAALIGSIGAFCGAITNVLADDLHPSMVYDVVYEADQYLPR